VSDRNSASPAIVAEEVQRRIQPHATSAKPAVRSGTQSRGMLGWKMYQKPWLVAVKGA
jgi:hypothetical protein